MEEHPLLGQQLLARHKVRERDDVWSARLLAACALLVRTALLVICIELTPARCAAGRVVVGCSQLASEAVSVGMSVGVGMGMSSARWQEYTLKSSTPPSGLESQASSLVSSGSGSGYTSEVQSGGC